MDKTALVVLAAGMGSRYGGLKQMEPFGINGEAILDFSVMDAIDAGYSEVVLIIKKEIEHDFRELVGKRIEKLVNVRYAFQELSKLPKGFVPPEGRIKPWGTAHALLCAEGEIDSPFVIINSDDYYGKEGLSLLRKHLLTEKDYCLAAYRLCNTLSDKGKVSRGICEIKNGYLENIIEDKNVDKNSGYAVNTPVSMNMWGMDMRIFDCLKEYFADFLKESINIEKSEYILTSLVQRGMEEGKFKIRAYETSDKWYGVTYREDTEEVKAALQNMQRRGLYNGLLK